MHRPMHRLACALLVMPMLAACQPGGTATAPRPTVIADEAPPPPLWRTRIDDADVPRLDALPTGWAQLYGALRPATRRLFGAVLDPAAAQSHPAPPPGSYRCRTIRLRAVRHGLATAQATAPGFCFLSGTDEVADPAPLGLAKQTGADVVAGYVFPDGKRYVFLGAKQARAGDNSLGYGVDRARDTVGVFERYGLFRWRMAVAGPDGRSMLVYELTPVPADGQPR